MAYGLIILVNSGNKNYFHIEDYLKRQNCDSAIRGDIVKLKYFGLIEPRVETREDGSDRNGYYKVTEKAISFVNRKIKVPKYFNIFNNKLMGYSEEQVDIADALNNKFEYEKLMNK